MTTRIICDGPHDLDVPAVARVTCFFNRGNATSGIKSWDSCHEHIAQYVGVAWDYGMSEEGLNAADESFAEGRGRISDAETHASFMEVRVTPYRPAVAFGHAAA